MVFKAYAELDQASGHWMAARVRQAAVEEEALLKRQGAKASEAGPEVRDMATSDTAAVPATAAADRPSSSSSPEELRGEALGLR